MNKHKQFLIISLLIVSLLGCTHHELNPVQEVESSRVSFVNSSEIPNIFNKVNQVHSSRYSASQGWNSTNALNLDSILQVIDTLDNTNYTISVLDNDHDPYTFTNLIINKDEHGNIGSPYLLEYAIDDSYKSQFLRDGFSLKNFTGQITKRNITEVSQDGYSKSDISLSGSSSIEDCSSETYYFGNGTLDGQNVSTGEPTNSSLYISSGCTAMVIEYYVRETSDKAEGTKYWSGPTTFYERVEIVVWVCPGDENHTTANIDDCNPETDEQIGVLLDDSPELAALRVLTPALNEEVSLAIEDLIAHNSLPNGDIDWESLLEALEFVFIDLGLIEIVPFIGELYEFRSALQHFDAGEINKGALVMASVIVGLIPAGKIIKAVSRINDLRKGISIGFRLYKFQKYLKRIGIPIQRYTGGFAGRTNYRQNLKAFTKLDPPSNVHAHHIFPREFDSFFSRYGDDLDIHNPKNLTWWEGSDHLKKATPYNNAWEVWISNNQNATVDQVIAKGKSLMEQYGNGIPTSL